jgi:hypothetical protein
MGQRIDDKANMSDGSSRPSRPLLVLEIGPQYSVSLFENGSAEYVGWHEVKTKGRVQYQLPSKVVAEIIARVKNANVAAMAQRADPLAFLSAPTNKLTVNIDGKESSVYFSGLTMAGGRTVEDLEFLRDLQVLLDTEQFRCPYASRDLGPLGQIDLCNSSIARISYFIEQEKTRNKEK